MLVFMTIIGDVRHRAIDLKYPEIIIFLAFDKH